MNKHNESPKQAYSSQANTVNLPYFDYLLSVLNDGDDPLNTTFGRHVHWGYWEHPNSATLTQEDFAQAAEELSKQVCSAGHLQNNLSVLDVGCGFGGTIAHINENYQGMRLIGINLDERQLVRAREMVKPSGNNMIEFKHGNACTLPLPDQAFDVVLAVECIFHFPDREQFFKEAYRVLKPGGYLALSDFVSKPVIQPVMRLKMLDKLSVGFYGKCNLEYGVEDYHKLAQKTAFTMNVERDITVNTLPTYSYLRRASQQYRIYNFFALFETAAAEVLSKLRLLNYNIYGFQK